MNRSLTLENVILFHQKIITATGGTLGIRDRNLIASALKRPFMTFDGINLYPTTTEKIAAVTHSLICNHGFVDGNKRIGIAVMLVLLRQNHIEMNYTQTELIELGLRVAEGQLKERDITDWIKKHSGADISEG